MKNLLFISCFLLTGAIFRVQAQPAIIGNDSMSAGLRREDASASEKRAIPAGAFAAQVGIHELATESANVASTQSTTAASEAATLANAAPAISGTATTAASTASAGAGTLKATAAPPDSTRAFQFLDSVFNRAECVFLTTEPDIPADLQSILIRLNNTISANKAWFLQYKEANAGQPLLPYDEHFGVTRQEYARVQHLEQFPPHMLVLDSQRVAIHSLHDHIQLEGDSSARILNYLEILVKDRKLVFAGDTLPFVGEMEAPPSSPFGKWHGFVWRLEKTDVQSSLQTNQITARVIEVDAGLPMQPDGKVFLRIKYQDVAAGVSRADMDLTGYIR